MKLKVTERTIKENFPEIMMVGYCKMQSTLNHFSPLYYTCGVYGWKSDIYVIDDMCIVTGYSPFGTFAPDKKEIDRVNKKYEQIYAKNLPYENEVAQVKKLLKTLYK